MRDAGQQLRATRKAVSYPPLFTWLRRAAINVRIHACVVERAGQDRYSDRAGTAAADVIRVIAALCGGYTADDQPDDKKCRSEMHPGLRSNTIINRRGEIPYKDGKALRDGPRLRGSVPAGNPDAPSRNLEDRIRVSRRAAR
jgi:hypothetical protein